MPRMDVDKKRLITSILHFLRGEFKLGYLNSENAEGLEVAIQCLETVYETSNTTETEPALLDIYKAYLTTSVINKPDASENDKKEAEKLKVEGNSAMNSGLFVEAIELYTKAIGYDAKNAVYYCNRAAAHSKLHAHNQAIIDCKIAIEIDPSYSKAYGRLGLAYCGLEDYMNALDNYKRALVLEPTNDGYRKNYELALMKVSEQRCGSGNGAGTPGAAGRKTDRSSSTQADVGGGGAASGLSPAPSGDVAALFENPHLLNFAQQMFADPGMQNIISTIMNGSLNPEGGGGGVGTGTGSGGTGSGGTGGGGRGVEELFQVGQRLAQQMQTEHPTMVEELRQVFEMQRNEEAARGNNPNPNNPQDKKPSGGSQDKK